MAISIKAKGGAGLWLGHTQFPLETGVHDITYNGEKCQVAMTRPFQAWAHLFYSEQRAQMHIDRQIPSSQRTKVPLESPQELSFALYFVILTDRDTRPLNCNLSLISNSFLLY